MVVQWYIDQNLIEGHTPVNNYSRWNQPYWDHTVHGQDLPPKTWSLEKIPKQISGMLHYRPSEMIRKSAYVNEAREEDVNFMFFEHNGNHIHYVFSNEKHSLFRNIPVDIWEWLARNSSVYLVIAETLEAKLDYKALDILQETYGYYKEKYGLKNKIILSNLAENINELFANYELPSYISLIPNVAYGQTMLAMLDKRVAIDEYCTEFKDTKKFKYKVLTFNGRYRLARALLFREVKKVFKDEDILYSFRPPSCSWQKDLGPKELMKAYNKDNKIPQQTINDLLAQIELGPDMNISNPVVTGYAKLDNKWTSHFPNHDDYKHTFCEVVSETYADREFTDRNYESAVLMLTEKITKPMLARRPFLVSSNPGMLKALKDYGFKTFDKWFDESYDDQDIGLLESTAILKSNLELINSMSTREVLSIYREMKPVLEYNYRRALKFIWKEKPKHINSIINHIELNK